MNVYIGIPIFDKADPQFVKCLSVTKEVLQKVGHTVEVDFNSGCSIITKARNDIVARFIDSKFDLLLFIDSDMVWDAIDVVKLVSSLRSVCGIAYRRKEEEITYNVTLNNKKETVDGQLWLGADLIGTGMLAIQRQALILMMKYYPRLKYFDGQNADEKRYALFDFSLEGERYWGEDYTFCKRWTNMGGKIWCLPAEIGHIGKAVFSGNIKEPLND